MRRKEREITDRGLIDAIISKAQVCRIGLCDRGLPYVVPVTFGHKDNRLFIHSAAHGRKMEIIRANNNVCFEVEADVEMVPAEKACDWTVRYYSVIGVGTASIVEDREEKARGLDIIMEHYSHIQHHDYPEAILNKLAIIRIDITSLTGKKSGY